ncbi:MAG: hypothetical protein IJJ71_06925 [Treponema sp.]|uniref:hypothetical protein n=1 Tax=Treponema sp. TaxID=166 RepID=UPI0026015257|nr:hypothetical protein [Treponema sp.]MBQ9621887.1 hypothetical protein [Treponema sp.]MBR0495887.1 hypothetical protein [Treponema sp.]
MRKSIFLAIIFQLSVFNFPFSAFPQSASSSEVLAPRKVGTDDMLELFAEDVLDGDYEIAVESSASMFRIVQSVLHVKDGKMTATLTMSGKGYSKLFLGTSEEAGDSKGEGEILPLASAQDDGPVMFEIPVSALNSSIKCAAFSKKKSKWYDRDILFDASTLPAEKLLSSPKIEQINLKDGNYFVNVELTGGSGRAKITSPAKVSVKGGKAVAIIEWSSPNFDYMKVNHERYDADTKILEKGGNSTFRIPVYAFDKKLPVTADTVAMSKAHEINYWLQFDSNSAKKTRKKF